MLLITVVLVEPTVWKLPWEIVVWLCVFRSDWLRNYGIEVFLDVLLSLWFVLPLWLSGLTSLFSWLSDLMSEYLLDFIHFLKIMWL